MIKQLCRRNVSIAIVEVVEGVFEFFFFNFSCKVCEAKVFVVVRPCLLNPAIQFL